MEARSPELFILTAISELDATDVVLEKFWRSTYAHDADRLLEASAFAEKMFDAGFSVEYSEVEDIERA
jgi:hypothetical protein